MKANLASPWRLLESVVDKQSELNGSVEQRLGLQPWWVVSGGHHERIVLAPSFSHEAARFERMSEELAYYRLAIGQPDPETFIERLRGRITIDELRKLAIDLSGARLRSRRAEPASSHRLANSIDPLRSQPLRQLRPLPPA